MSGWLTEYEQSAQSTALAKRKRDQQAADAQDDRPARIQPGEAAAAAAGAGASAAGSSAPDMRVEKYLTSLRTIQDGCNLALRQNSTGTAFEFDADLIRQVMPPTNMNDAEFFVDSDRIEARRTAWNRLLVEDGGLDDDLVKGKELLFHLVMQRLDWMGGDERFKWSSCTSNYGGPPLAKCTLLEAFIQIEIIGRYQWVNARNLFVFVGTAIYGRHALTALEWVAEMFGKHRNDDNGDTVETWADTQGGYRWSDEDWDEGDTDLGTRTGDKGSTESQLETAFVLVQLKFSELVMGNGVDAGVDTVVKHCLKTVGAEYVDPKFQTIGKKIVQAMSSTRASAQFAVNLAREEFAKANDAYYNTDMNAKAINKKAAADADLVLKQAAETAARIVREAAEVANRVQATTLQNRATAREKLQRATEQTRQLMFSF
jgi:hypothetical protein